MPLETFEKLPAERQETILAAGIREFSRKSYTDASTDSITKECNISKGILFHYFGSKKAFYLYCLERSMERLTQPTEEVAGNDFYEILFDSMTRKMNLCLQFSDEMHMVNMASREAAADVALQKSEVLQKYMSAVQNESGKILNRALETLPMRTEENRQLTAEGLHMYINAVLNHYLARYQQTPDLFFAHSEEIKQEMKEYLDLMLYGICGEKAQ
ncbi:MAG: TetR/AcrR family transcriptional regulator [Solobacterium sp.]|nr:TetR/AcrR family transcriptional regulator [Solobacterium sp.]